MQILYGTATAAIFMLCLVLLWTSRRILRSSPIPNAEFSLARLHEAIERNSFAAQTRYADIAPLGLEPEVAEISNSLLDSIALDMPASATSLPGEWMNAPVAVQVQEAMQPILEMPPQPQIEFLAEPQVDFLVEPRVEVAVESADAIAEPEPKRNGRIAKHTTHGYNYMLEGLLLGVSVFVLIRTQRSNWRYHERSLRSSDQVA